ncbi:ICMT-domain-containing protein [Rhizophagus clarus]|uniref:Protein-S-isoprenylcysteine O-methyltransferase n=1 Tax=Rhizophagus clarus TaxID=94130 RepID=A0A8H3KSI3_9GLOM|nr:ICMT-domain-containing protein [Rhizophagus clarus]
MYSKTVALLIQAYFTSKVFTPPNKNLTVKKAVSTEGLTGMIFANILPKFLVTLNLLRTLVYIYMMYQQEIGSIPILPDRNYKFSDWNFIDIFCLLSAIGGSLLRLWCFKTLKEFFTFNVVIQKDHKLITDGPYSLLVHPAYTGGFLMAGASLRMWYQLFFYIPIYFNFGAPGQGKTLLLLIIGIQLILQIFSTHKRITHEEKELKKHFGKEWDVYFSQRKRLIPYIF